MATTITAVQTNRIAHAVFIDLTLDETTYYISSAYEPITVNGNVYTELGALLSVSSLTEDLKTSSGDVRISLSGIPSEADYMTIVLGSPIKGGTVKIRRVFFDPDTLQPISGQEYLRYTGIITNYSVEEQSDILAGELTNAITVTCASLNTLLENRVTGQRTNGTDRKRFFSGDISFDRVKDLQNTDFDFGKKYQGGTGYGGPSAPPGTFPGFNPRNMRF